METGTLQSQSAVLTRDRIALVAAPSTAFGGSPPT